MANKIRLADSYLSALFNADVAACVATSAMFDQLPWPEELSAIERATSKRRREFSAGRAAARLAMAKLGISNEAIPVNRDRTPHWPSAITGSISHCEGLCCAVVALKKNVSSLGLDVEPSCPLDEGVRNLVFCPDEQNHIASLPLVSGACWDKLAFCAKEAFYKAYYPIQTSFVEFQDLRIRILPLGNTFGEFAVTFEDARDQYICEKYTFTGRWRITDGYCLAGASIFSGSFVYARH